MLLTHYWKCNVENISNQAAHKSSCCNKQACPDKGFFSSSYLQAFLDIGLFINVNNSEIHLSGCKTETNERENKTLNKTIPIFKAS